MIYYVLARSWPTGTDTPTPMGYVESIGFGFTDVTGQSCPTSQFAAYTTDAQKACRFENKELPEAIRQANFQLAEYSVQPMLF